MKYITCKRYKKKSLSGEVNLPRLTEVDITPYGGMEAIWCDGKPVCLSTSQDAYDYFARNDDGSGIQRYGLTRAIMKLLATRDDDYQTRWDRLWNRPDLERFRRRELRDHWIWSYDFYNAKIADLEEILNTVKGVV